MLTSIQLDGVAFTRGASLRRYRRIVPTPHRSGFGAPDGDRWSFAAKLVGLFSGINNFYLHVLDTLAIVFRSTFSEVWYAVAILNAGPRAQSRRDLEVV